MDIRLLKKFRKAYSIVKFYDTQGVKVRYLDHESQTIKSKWLTYLLSELTGLSSERIQERREAKEYQRKLRYFKKAGKL